MFNKQKFAGLLKKAMGDRSGNEFALHTGVSATHISNLLRCLNDTAPNPAIIKKLATKAYGGVTYEDLMAAAGHINTDRAPNVVRENRAAYSTLDDEWPELARILRRKGKKITEEERRRIIRIMKAAVEDTEEG